MDYATFEDIVSEDRLRRYLNACNGDKRKALTLYRYNLKASEAMFAVVSGFEVALRNAIDKHLIAALGNDWLRDSVMTDGVFSLPILRKTRDIINGAYIRLTRNTTYSHPKLLAEMEFGIWKYMFSPVQYRQTGRNLLHIFPNKPRSTRERQYNQTSIFNELDKVNSLRNRIAHHEPICFRNGTSILDTSYIETIYNKIITLFDWMGIDSGRYLYGLDHVAQTCEKIKSLT
ncbi:MAG: Abi family protein [Paramuribaculum sp.]|nr:Abi family protein [Paramuribaculum sp.]